MLRLEDNETNETIEVDADAIKADYLDEVAKFRATYKQDCVRTRIDYVPLHTGMPFDKALDELSAHAAGPGLTEWSDVAMELSIMHAGLAAGAAAGGLAGDPAPVHASDAEARDLPGAAADPGTPEAIQEADARSRTGCCCWRGWRVIALMALALGRPSLLLARFLWDRNRNRRRWASCSTPAIDGLHRERQNAAGRSQGARARVGGQAARLEPGLRGRLGRAAGSGRAMSPAAALKRIESLTIRPVNRPLNSAMGQVYRRGRRVRPAAARRLRADGSLPYVVAARTGRRKGSSRSRSSRRSKGSRIVTFILGVASKEVTNVAVDTAEPSSTRRDPG